MAIFNKKKKDAAVTAAGGSNNARGTITSGSPQQTSSYSDRSMTGSSSLPSLQQRGGPLQAGASSAAALSQNPLATSLSEPQLSSPGQLPPQQPPSTGPLQTPGPPSNTILYPWAQRRINLLPSALLSTDPAQPGAPQPTWGPLSAPPFPRYGHSVNPVATSPTGDLYIFGGLVSNAVKNDLYLLSCAPNMANSAGPPGTLSVGLLETRGEIPGPRVGHASVGVGNVLIVWGGDTKSRPTDVQDDGLYLLNLSESWVNVLPEGLANLRRLRCSRHPRMDARQDHGRQSRRPVWARRCHGGQSLLCLWGPAR